MSALPEALWGGEQLGRLGAGVALPLPGAGLPVGYLWAVPPQPGRSQHRQRREERGWCGY